MNGIPMGVILVFKKARGKLREPFVIVSFVIVRKKQKNLFNRKNSIDKRKKPI